jgi:hypothetical protein
MGEHVKVGLQVAAGIAIGFVAWRMFLRPVASGVLGTASNL